MPALDNRFLDAALNKLRDEATDIFVCSADPGLDFNLATHVYALASYSPPPFGPNEDRPGGGRRISITPSSAAPGPRTAPAPSGPSSTCRRSACSSPAPYRPPPPASSARASASMPPSIP